MNHHQQEYVHNKKNSNDRYKKNQRKKSIVKKWRIKQNKKITSQLNLSHSKANNDGKIFGELEMCEKNNFRNAPFPSECFFSVRLLKKVSIATTAIWLRKNKNFLYKRNSDAVLRSTAPARLKINQQKRHWKSKKSCGYHFPVFQWRECDEFSVQYNL